MKATDIRNDCVVEHQPHQATERQQGTSGLIRRPTVEERTSLPKSTPHKYVIKGSFPKPTPLGPRAVESFEIDIYTWIDNKVAVSRSTMEIMQ